jgi:hypothetical protein
MPDKIASTSEFVERRQVWWRSRLTLFLVSLLLGIQLLAMTYVVVRIREANRVYSQFLSLQAEVNELQKHHMAQMQEAADRLDTLERVLFGNVVAKLASVEKPPSQARVQLWQKTRDTELRQRLSNLEYWRWEIEQGYRR